MEKKDCDFSHLKLELREQLSKIRGRLDHVMANLDAGDSCLLNEIENMSRFFADVEALASTYYLNCFLSPYTNHYNDISQVMQRLSAKRLGALIVIEREHALDPILSPGIPILARISSSLLESIFVPGSPLHDGAVLIRQDMIVSAANILPLTERTYGEKKIGTRHRAAIGLSELTDALVLVVSEETGKTSFCMNGTLYPFSAS